MMELLAGIGLDSSVVPVRHGSLSLIQTTDFFYPLVDSPYIMVCIDCCAQHSVHVISYFKNTSCMLMNLQLYVFCVFDKRHRCIFTG